MISSEKSASQVLRPFSLYPQKLVNLNVVEKRPLDSIDGLEAIYQTLDAANIRYLVRYSGTENKLRLLLEGKDAAEMEAAMKDLSDFFKKALNG